MKTDTKKPEPFKIISSPSMPTGTNPNLNPFEPHPNPSQLLPDPDPLPLPLPHPLPLLPVTMIWLPELLLNWLRLSAIPYQTAFKLTKGRLFMDTWGYGYDGKNGKSTDLIDYSLQMALHFDSIIRSIYNATTTHLSKIKFRIKIWFTLLNLVSLSRTIHPTLWTFLKYLLLALLMFFWICLLSKVFFITIHGDN